MLMNEKIAFYQFKASVFSIKMAFFLLIFMVSTQEFAH